MLTSTEVEAYLSRLGFEGAEAPTKDFLFALHRAHVARISWQTVDIYAGRPVSMALRDSVGLMTAGRSGYCFHLNGAFSALLRTLGYDVAWHRAGVQPIGREAGVNNFHLGLTVDLKGSDSGEQRYVIDVGLGDMPFEPIPLAFGRYRQGPFAYELKPSAVAEGGWRMEHDPLHGYIGVDFAPELVPDLALFHPNHAHYSQSPDSPWMNQFLVRQRDEKSMNELRGCVWKAWDADGCATTEVARKNDWLALLADVFGERLAAYSQDERDSIWICVLKQHEEWKREREENKGSNAEKPA
ncbi:arylamine N-acetyltransferase family protein [Paenibacillus methanolicus]|uniref:Arylamine N-acetyltransferase n=1 Tax=Paenibacillus methanolicus TaxID=582686 RepID=A0A5S5CN03_9BACL|nr:arylamine N-acetyltransferase [Paenibacillus methanolicus]